MIIPLYNTIGQVISERKYEFDPNTKDLGGSTIVYPDRLLGFSMNGFKADIVLKDFYMTKNGVLVEKFFEKKYTDYQVINGLYSSKLMVVEAIEARLLELKLSVVRAKYAFEKIVGGTEAEQLFQTLVYVSTANNLVVSKVVSLSLGFSKSKWKVGLRNYLEASEREWVGLIGRLKNITDAEANRVALQNVAKQQLTNSLASDSSSSLSSLWLLLIAFFIFFMTKTTTKK